MILDAALTLADAQAITVTATSSKVIDLGPESYVGNANGGGAIPIAVSVDESFTADGAATLQIAVRSSKSADMSSPKVHYLTPAIAKADLAAGKAFPAVLAIPYDAQRYVDLSYTVATGPFTAGKLTAVVTTSRQTNK